MRNRPFGNGKRLEGTGILVVSKMGATFKACCSAFGSVFHHPFIGWFAHVTADVFVFAFWGLVLSPFLDTIKNVKPH